MFGAKNNYLILSDYIRFEHLSNMAVKVKFYDNSYQPEKGLTYSLIAAICKGQWIFVRHRDKLTWEIAGGHIEKAKPLRRLQAENLLRRLVLLHSDYIQ